MHLAGKEFPRDAWPVCDATVLTTDFDLACDATWPSAVTTVLTTDFDLPAVPGGVAAFTGRTKAKATAHNFWIIAIALPACDAEFVSEL
jgi:hypothetical protein